jgi:AcrR family transcriptional regulator
VSVAGTARPTRPLKSRRPRSSSRAQLEAVRERQGAHVAGVQRARLLAGAVRAVDKYEYAHTTVSEITALAHVSRRTFYELFAGSEECLLAMVEEIVGRAQAQVAAAELDGLAWREQVRGGLWAILSFLDAEPVLARVGVVQSARGGPQIIEFRERLLAKLAGVIGGGRSADSRAGDCPELTAEGLVGAVLSILHTRLVRGERQPLKSLQGELMAMIVAPYLGPVAARAERNRAAPAPLPAPRPDNTESTDGNIWSGTVVGTESDPLNGVSMRFTYRTTCVLEAVAARPGLSNRGVGNAAGIPDQGQVSKLLARLEGFGLMKNTAPFRRGAPNAWELTPEGEQIARLVGIGTGGGVGA